ncbi:MAG: hypothetical protein COT81_01070 [Candidatus Buchananbacteria bacterium CG10_big_fil_rev_8_21_14_0_10_42_9]|uniref:Uncharacterized protein n=1 Tax=Candidatus Buchananbacteria bacterium CG10_big_fil_rev_8_21_14_0_10_42_9 TaxID=1974526 RepID=A0A2H0W279_9BACT|nr:MAG: hypothetical protein COT81_01070 [Candidatus Buchananbacteria bacterium CG10_big_fil_rev_8_21_14_0_10_42_9]
MPRFFLLAKKTNPVKAKRRTQIKFKFPPVHIEKLLGALVVVFLAAYLVLTNGVSTKGYQIEKLEKQLKSLQTSTSNLETQILEAQSSKTIDGKVADLNLVSASSVTYLTITDNAVALNE